MKKNINLNYQEIRKEIEKRIDDCGEEYWFLYECLDCRKNTGQRNILSHVSPDDLLEQLSMFPKCKLDKRFVKKYKC